MTVQSGFARYRDFGKHWVCGCNLSVLFLILSIPLLSCVTAPVGEVPQSTASPSPSPSLSIPPKLQISDSQVQFGALALVTVITNGTQVSGAFEGVQLEFYEIPDTTPKTYQAILPVPYDRHPGPAVVQVKVQGETSEIPFQVVEGHYSSEALHVDPSRVTPPAKALPRINSEIQEVGAIYHTISNKKYWKGPFQMPIVSDVTSAFGTRRVYNRQLKNFHTGLDLRAAMGTPIFSAASGKVVMAKNLYYTGNTVILDHGFGVVTLYCHMNEMKVALGAEVGPHQLLGLSGKTGRVNGPHLHWQAVVDGVKTNPLGLTREVIQ